MTEAHNLKELLLSEICLQTPQIFSGDNPLMLPQDNLLAQFTEKIQLLLSRGTPIDDFFKNLKEQGGGSTICGHVFDRGDFFYTCIECSTDPTCVFCKECFFSSAHVEHLYKMFASCGAGSCDCGDVEAWTKDPHCDIHKPQIQTSLSDPLSFLPDWLTVHGHGFCHFIFEYAINLQICKDWKTLSPDFMSKLQPFNKNEAYCVVVMNDEVNRFDDVAALFVRELGIPNRESISLTYAIDKLGRALVREGDQQACIATTSSLSQLDSIAIPLILAQHQQCSVFLLTALLNICSQTPGLQKLCAMTLFSTDLDITNGNTILEYIFSVFPSLWINACEAWLAIFLQLVIPQEDTKKMFAEIYLKNYETILFQYVENVSKEECNLHFMSVQLFTSPSLSIYLIERSNALVQILNVLESCLSDKGREKVPINSSAIKSFNKHRMRHSRCTSCDLGYLLRHTPNSAVLTESVRDAFLQGLKSHVTVLKLFEGTDAIKKELLIHVPVESDWKEIFYFQRLLQPITSSFIAWLSKNRSLLLESVNFVFETLQQMQPAKIKSTERTVFRNYTCQILPGVVTTLQLSCHIPLTRLLSGLLSACHSQGINLTTDTCLRDERILHWLFERCLRPLVLKSQVLNNFWKKNGMSVSQMITNYHTFLCNEMYYRDIHMLQLLTAYLPTDFVLLNLIQKFEVAKWFESDYAHSKSSSAVDRNLFIQNMCEEMLGTLITIIIDRNNSDIAELTEEEVMEQKLINILFLDHWKHQNLIDELTRGNYSSDYSIQNTLDTQLPIIANESFVSRKKHFTLKPKYYDRVCVFFYHDSKENQSQSNNQLKSLCQLNKDMLTTLLTPPLMPNFRPHLRPILCILEHPLFFHILFIILERTRNESELVTDYITHQALFLIAIGIQEEKLGNISGFKDSLKGASANSSFDFLPILAILSSIPSCTDIRELIDWINTELLPKEQIQDISEQITAREDSEKKLIEEIQEAQTKAMDDLKKRQASFLVGFGSSDEDDDETIEKPVQGQTRVLPDCAGIGVQCLNSLPDQESIACIFCQENTENQSLTETGKFFVLPGYCSSYSGLRKGQSTVKSLHDTDAVLTPATLDVGVITKSCGHTFHFVCWDQFMKGSSSTYSQLVISPEEFKCPLCYSVCNTIIPLSQGLNYNAEVSETHKPPSFEQFLNLLSGITNAKFYTENAVSLATAFCDCFHELPDKFHSIRFFTDNEDAFKLQAKCKEIAYAGEAPVDPSFIVNAMNNTVNYTLQSKNNEIMSLERLVSDEVSAHQRLVLRSIVHTAVIAKNLEFHQVYCQNTNTILDTLLTSSDNPDTKIFDYDAFSLLVNLQFSLPHLISEVVQTVPDFSVCLNLLPTISLHVFKLLLYYRLVQILLCTNLATLSADAEHDGVNRDSLFKLWTLRRKALPEQLRQSNFSMKPLHGEVVRLILPFLRSASMFYNLLLNLPFPSELSVKTDESVVIDDFEQVERLLAFIGCPSLMSCISEVFTTPNLEELVRNWFAVSSNFSLVYAQHIQHPSHIVFPYGGLVNLPKNYIDILTEAFAYECPITRQRGDEVIKCMVCGKYVCLSCFACSETYKQSASGKPAIGPFTEHILQCSNGVGIGIWVKNACMLLLSVSLSSENLPATGTIQQVPYIDQFGEHDRELRKGSPLYLSPQGYMEINQIWMQNNVPGAIEKSNEDRPHFSGINWKSF